MGGRITGPFIRVGPAVSYYREIHPLPCEHPSQDEKSTAKGRAGRPARMLKIVFEDVKEFNSVDTFANAYTSSCVAPTIAPRRLTLS